MSEKSFAVRLTAKIAEYKAKMAEAAAATKGFAGKSDAELQKLGKRMSDVGGKMTTRLTLPLAAAGGAALKLSTDFDGAMTKITALVGISADEVDGMKQSVLDLAGNTAKGPQELADALFVVTSAGLRGEAAMEALEFAAKASAAGLGETNDIARAVAGAMNAYGPAALDAASATDVLVATARAGNFETSELAASLGQVLPWAKQAEASFEDVGGAVALLTRTNGNASQSITQVTGLMRAFVVPTAEARTILGELGMTADEVRSMIGEQGLVATLQHLDDRLGGNREQLGRLIGSSEGAAAAFQILDADAASLESTFGDVADAAGMTDEAFDATAESGAFKMRQAWADLQVALIQVGEIIAPIAAGIAGAVADLAEKFSSLPGPVQKLIVVLGGVVAATGPLLSVGGKVVANLSSIRRGFQMAGAAGTAMGATLAAAAVAYAVHSAKMARKNAEFQQSIEDLGRAADEEIGRVFVDSMLRGVFAGREMEDAIAEITRSSPEAARRLLDVEDASGVLSDAMLDMGSSADEAAELVDTLRGAVEEEDRALAQADATLDEYATTTDDAAFAADAMADDVDEATVAFEDVAAAAADAEQAHRDYVDEVLRSLSTMFDYESAVLATEEAYDAYKQMVEETTLIVLDSERTDAEKTEALRNQRQEHIRLAEQVYQTSQRYAENQGAVEGSTEAVQLQIAELIRQRDKYPELRTEIDGYIAKLLGIPGAVPTDIQAEIDDEKLAEAERKLELLARQRTATITVHTVGGPRQADHRAGIPSAENAYGGFYDRFTFTSLVEDGDPEVVLPLAKRSRLDELVSMPQVFGPLAASMARVAPSPAPAQTGTQSVTKLDLQTIVYGTESAWIDKLADELQRRVWGRTG